MPDGQILEELKRSAFGCPGEKKTSEEDRFEYLSMAVAASLSGGEEWPTDRSIMVFLG
jgi:hypothetical protein